MNVAILGCGSLGGVMAARLAEHPDIELTVVDRDPQIAEAIISSGLILKKGRKSQVFSVRLVQEAEAEPYDALILATKCNGLLQAAESMKSNLTPDACVVTVQNGLVAFDLLQAVGSTHLVPGCVLWGSSMEAPGIYRITASGNFIIGTLEGPAAGDPAVRRAETILTRIFPVVVSSNIRGVLWSKLAITSTFTAIGAITGLPFGKLAASRKIRDIMLAIGQELWEVTAAEHIALESLSAGLNIERLLSDRGYSRFIKHLLLRIIGGKHGHTVSSMLDSIRMGIKTEIDYINGRIVLAAERAGVQVPFNRLVVNMVREMEQGILQPSPANLEALFEISRERIDGGK